MVYSTHKYFRTKFCNRKLDMQANIYPKRKAQKTTVSHLTAPKEERGSNVTSHLASLGDTRPPSKWGWHHGGFRWRQLGASFLAFGGTSLGRDNGISLLGNTIKICVTT